jgi:hypothetical protein
MSRKPKYFGNGKIYMLESDEGKVCYIGSTCGDLYTRLQRHKREMLKWGSGKKKFLTSFHVLKYSDAKMMLIEDYGCATEKELLAREGFHIRAAKGLDNAGCIYDYECVNKMIPGRTQREYLSDNYEHFLSNRGKKGRVERWKCHICDCYTIWPQEIHSSSVEHIRRADAREAIGCGLWGKLLRQIRPQIEPPYVYLEILDRSLGCHIYAYSSEHDEPHNWDAIDAAVLAYNLGEARRAESEACSDRPEWQLIPIYPAEEQTAEQDVELVSLTDPMFDAVVSSTELLSWSDAEEPVGNVEIYPIPSWADNASAVGDVPSFLADLGEMPIFVEDISAYPLGGHIMLIPSKL